MKNKILSLFKFRQKIILNAENVLSFSIIFLVFVYTFCLYSFSSRAILNSVTIVIAGVLAISILAYTFFYASFKIDEFAILLLILCFVILTSTIINNAFSRLTKSVFLISSLAFCLYQFSRIENHLNKILIALTLGGIGFFTYYFAHYFRQIITLDFLLNGTRLGDYFDNQNSVARYFTITSLISIYLGKKYKNLFFWLVPLLGFFLLITTGSISNMFVFVLLVFLEVFFLIKKGKRWICMISGIGILAFITILLQLPQLSNIKERILSVILTLLSGGGLSADGSTAGRIEFALDGLKLFFSSPLFGSGPGGVIGFTSGGYAHNTISELAGNYGIFAVIAFESMVLAPLLKIKQLKNDLAVMVLITALFMFVFQFFLVTYYTKIEYVLLPIMHGSISSKLLTSIQIKFLNNKANKRRSMYFKATKEGKNIYII